MEIDYGDLHDYLHSRGHAGGPGDYYSDRHGHAQLVLYGDYVRHGYSYAVADLMPVRCATGKALYGNLWAKTMDTAPTGAWWKRSEKLRQAG